MLIRQFAPWLFFALMLPATAHALDAGLVTSISGTVTLQEEASKSKFELRPFVKIREGDRLIFGKDSRIQIVYFRSGSQETWSGLGTIEIGLNQSEIVSGRPTVEQKKLSQMLVKQFAKTPEGNEGTRTGMVRMRASPPGGSIEATERIYAELRAQTPENDWSPEMFLLASYNEIKDFERMSTFISKLRAQHGPHRELDSLLNLYQKQLEQRTPAP